MYDTRPKNWWAKEVAWGITRNEVPFIVLGLVLLVFFYWFPVNWDWVFGLRPK